MSTQYNFSANIDVDIAIYPVDDRWYKIPHSFICSVDMGAAGVKRACVEKGFLFDGRSGGPLVDFYVPNLGTQQEVKRWIAHDLWSYDLGLTFRENNEMLGSDLKKYCGYGWLKAKLIKLAVGLDDGYFGRPSPGEREYVNLDKILVYHSNK